MADKNASVLWLSTGDRLFLGVLAPVIGSILGYFLPRVATWAASQAWIPAHGAFELVASWSQWWVRYALAGVGVGLGIAFVAFALYDTLKVVVAESGITLTEQGESREVDASEAATVFLDGKELVVLDGSSRQLVRAPIEEKPATVEQVFRSHGYCFVDGDPYRELYHLWVPDSPSLPAEANAVMRARAMALSKKSSVDARDLRLELDRIGVVVRDVKSKQYWRPLVHR